MFSENFIVRPFEEVTGGQYDDHGFYYTPNGSFWDPDGVYFNKEGFDNHGGYYNNHLEYIPGPRWIEELLCYEDEKEEVMKSSNYSNKLKRRNEVDEIYDGDDLDDDDELYDEIDYEKIMEEEEKKFAKMNMNMNHSVGRVKNNNEISKINPIEQTNKTPNVKISLSNSANTDVKNITNSKNKINDVPTDVLFKQIPNHIKQTTHPIDNKSERIKHTDANKERKEKQIEVDSLFQ